MMKTLDVNGIECPEICPVFCNEDEHMEHGGVDSRGCLTQDRCIVKCTGGDSCCSEENKCGVGEGDCDSDADCMEGLLCGTGNCPSSRSAFWDADDDCCYKPENAPTCIETGYHWIGNSQLVDKVDTDTAEQCQEVCGNDDRCNWFTWRDASNPKGCWLLSNKGDTKDEDHGRNQGATGPKNCDVTGCTVDGATGSGTTQGTCDREHTCMPDGTCQPEGGCTWACVAAGTSSTCRCPISETETVGRCYCDCGDGGRAGPGDYCYDNDDGQGVWSYAEPKTAPPA